MLNTRRERFLAISLGTAVVAFALWETAGRMLLQPLTDAQSAVAAAESQQAAMDQQSVEIEKAVQNLTAASRQSLPADPGKAAVHYQDWLIRTLAKHSIHSSIVTPAPAIEERNVGHRIPVSIQCTCSTNQIALFLDAFTAEPLLHRITHLNIANTGEGEAHQRVTMNIEALALSCAGEPQPLPEPRAISKESSLVMTLSENDIFCHKKSPQKHSAVSETERPKPAPRKTRPAETVPVRFDARKSIRFVASVWNGQQREAWFVDQRSQDEQSLTASTSLDFPDVQGRIVSIDSDALQLEVAGKRCRLRLGETLFEAESAK